MMDPDEIADVVGADASEPDPNPYHAPSSFSARAELANGTLCASVTLQGVAGEVVALIDSLGRLGRDLEQAAGHDVAIALRHRAGHIAERLGHLVQSITDAREDLEGKPF